MPSHQTNSGETRTASTAAIPDRHNGARTPGRPTPGVPASREIRERAEQRFTNAGIRIRSEAARAVDSARAKAAEEIRTLGAAATAAAGQLKHDDHGKVGSYVRGVGGGFENAADYLERSDVSEVTEDAACFARHNPAVFLGAAALLGFGLGRLVSAGAPRHPEHGVGDSFSGDRRSDTASNPGESAPAPKASDGAARRSPDAPPSDASPGGVGGT